MSATLEERIVYIIANAGDSRSCSLAAIDSAKNGDFEEAHRLMQEGQEAMHRAHVEHTDLLITDARENNVTVSMLLIHASNHLSVAEVSSDFAQEIIAIYERGVKNV